MGEFSRIACGGKTHGQRSHTHGFDTQSGEFAEQIRILDKVAIRRRDACLACSSATKIEAACSAERSESADKFGATRGAL